MNQLSSNSFALATKSSHKMENIHSKQNTGDHGTASDGEMKSRTINIKSRPLWFLRSSSASTTHIQEGYLMTWIWLSQSKLHRPKNYDSTANHTQYTRIFRWEANQDQLVQHWSLWNIIPYPADKIIGLCLERFNNIYWIFFNIVRIKIQLKTIFVYRVLYYVCYTVWV